MKKNGVGGFTTVMLLAVLAGLGYYTYLNNNTVSKKNAEIKTEKEELLEYDFNENYPKTVRETVKMHCKYLKDVYTGKYTEDELFTMNKQIRQLYDEELLEQNPQEKQLAELQEDIQQYDEMKKKFSSYSLAEASQVEYNTEDGVEYAKIKVDIILIVEGVSVSGEEEYILRKDDEGKWKILGWQVVSKDTTESEGDAD